MVHYGCSRSFKIIKIITSQKLVCELLQVFHCNHMLIFYRFRDRMIYGSKICFLSPFAPISVLAEALALNAGVKKTIELRAIQR